MGREWSWRCGGDGGGFGGGALSLPLTPGQRKATRWLSGYTLVDSKHGGGGGADDVVSVAEGGCEISGGVQRVAAGCAGDGAGEIAGDDSKTAMAVLKSLGVMDRVQPGPTDPEEVVRQQALERQVKDFEEKKKKLAMGDLSVWP